MILLLRPVIDDCDASVAEKPVGHPTIIMSNLASESWRDLFQATRQARLGSLMRYHEMSPKTPAALQSARAMHLDVRVQRNVCYRPMVLSRDPWPKQSLWVSISPLRSPS